MDANGSILGLEVSRCVVVVEHSTPKSSRNSGILAFGHA